MRPNGDVLAQRVDDELVLVNLETNRIFALNPTAARFWELLDAGNDRASILETMTREYGVPRDHLDREIDSLLTALAAEQLVVARDGA